MTTHDNGLHLIDTMRSRSRDWNRQHIDLWVAEGRRLRSEEINRILKNALRQVGAALDALVLAPLTRGRMLPKTTAHSKKSDHGTITA